MVVQWSRLWAPLQGPWVLPLVRGLKSYMLSSMAKNLKKEKSSLKTENLATVPLSQSTCLNGRAVKRNFLNPC